MQPRFVRRSPQSFERSWQAAVRPTVTSARRPINTFSANRAPAGLDPLQAQFNALMEAQQHPLDHLTRPAQPVARQAVPSPSRQVYAPRRTELS